ncbi:MAG TPA: hypothetical protein VH458_23100 [Vicinamibacterales bacterium]|jgi:hypothetical protein
MVNPMTAVLAVTLFVPIASEQRVQMRDLPPAVRTAVEAETRGSTLKGLSKEVEHGQTFYEAETTISGHSRDLLFDSNGTLVEVEEEIQLSAAPEPVRAALAGAGRLVKLESVTKGPNVTYEAHVVRNGKSTEILLDAAGKRVKEGSS